MVALREILAQGAALVRNMILARMIARADFGVAVTLGMVLSIFDWTSKMGLGRCVVQDKDGDNPEFVAAAHSLQLAGGLVGMVAVLALGPPICGVFNVAVDWPMLVMLAAILGSKGVEHLDLRRFERQLIFTPSFWAEVVPQWITVILAWPIAIWLADYRAVLALLLVKSCGTVVGSHLLAERPFRVSWSGPYRRSIWRFSWPLLVTGMVMLGITQGDRWIVAAYYGMEAMAPYAAAFGLLMALQFLVGHVVSSVALPLLAQVKSDNVAFTERYRYVLGVMLFYSVVSSALFIVGAEYIMRVVYGHKYAGSGPVMACLAAVAAFRSLRVAIATANLAKGDSKSELMSNVCRAGSLAPALWLAVDRWALEWVALSGLVGELLAMVICGYRLRRRDGIAMGVTLWPVVCIAMAITVFALLGVYTWQTPAVSAIVAAASGLVAGWCTVSCVRELRMEAQQCAETVWRNIVAKLRRVF
jgi:O-antigen/teichoic acid export membrane protein